MIVCTPVALQVGALSIPRLATSRFRPIDCAGAERLASRFQARLLDYRLRRHQQVAESQFDGADFACETRRVAVALGSVFEGDPELQARVIEGLRLADEGWKASHAQGYGAIVLEALLVACHEDRPEIYVNEVKDMVNALLLARQEKQELTAKAVGAILRETLGLYAQRSGAGYALELDTAYRERIHRLAMAHHTLSVLQPSSDCRFCHDSASSDAAMAGRELANLHREDEVPDVQEVHEVQARESTNGAGS
jgi:hypothetical protein